MTKFMRRALETPKELAWLAAKAALDSAEMKLDQIDGAVLGSAPDAFDGMHMKGEYLADGCGGWRKPYLRCYVGGGTGVYAVAQGWFQVASGLFDTALVVCEEKMSTCQPCRTSMLPTPKPSSSPNRISWPSVPVAWSGMAAGRASFISLCAAIWQARLRSAGAVHPCRRGSVCLMWACRAR